MIPLSAYAQPMSDWTSWAGPNRDFSVGLPSQSKILNRPRLEWEHSIGSGHSAVVVEGNACYCQFSRGKTEYVQRLDLKDGRLVWEASYPVEFASDRFPGPHATPALSNGRLVTASIDGEVRAFDVSTGNIEWRVDLRRKFATTIPQSGYASSPLIVGDLVVVTTLGKAQRVETEDFQPPAEGDPPGAVGLDLASGRTVWQSPSFRSSHSSPTLIVVGKKPVVCVHGMFDLVGIDPRSGAILWTHRLRDRASDNVAFTPLWDSERQQLIISHGYCDLGAQAIGLSEDGGHWTTKQNWSNRTMRIVYTNAVIVSDTLVGTSATANSLLVGLNCLDGSTRFRKRGLTNANFIRLDQSLMILEDEGMLRYGTLSENGFVQRWQLQTSANKTWTVPTWNDRRLLVRSKTTLQAFAFD
ncbi:MAG: PQQ-binding-like beta-propeller repeat protein [Planctomycetota bacterium]